MRTERIEVNGLAYKLNIHYENRRNSTASIGKKSINIHIPLSMGREEQFRQLCKMKQWAIGKLSEMPANQPRKEYKEGDILKVGNEEYILGIRLEERRSSSARIDNNRIYLVLAAGLAKEEQDRHISTLLSRCIASKRLPALERRIMALNALHFNKSLGKIRFKHNKSCWGSCSILGNINISTRLLFAPDDVLDYVCVHELAHLVEQNHSGHFWALVEKAVPGYKAKISWLKENRDKCTF